MALVVVVLVSLLMMSLFVLTLASQNHADTSATRDHHFDLALSVAEAGVQEAVAKIQASVGTFTGEFTGQTAEGSYAVTVERNPSQFLLTSRGSAGSRLGRTRVVRVTMEPPLSFSHALFSNTSIDLKNLDEVTGDVWANDSVKIEANDTITGSVTAARGYVDLDSGSAVTKNVWTGGFNSVGPFAIRLANGASVGGWAKASVTAPACDMQDPANYEVPLGTGPGITGDLTTFGQLSGSGSVGGTYTPNICTTAPVPRALPAFAFNANNYDAGTLHVFSSVYDFQVWLSGHLGDLKGTFSVTDPSPSQTNRIDLTGAVVTGDTTIITNAPIFTNGVKDTGSTERTIVLVSSYQPPTGAACDVNHDNSECAVHVKNEFQPNCVTAVLIYADRGPVAVKNNAEMCGAIYADSILVKNNQTLEYTSRVGRIVGFGASTYEVRRWEELSPG